LPCFGSLKVSVGDSEKSLSFDRAFSCSQWSREKEKRVSAIVEEALGQYWISQIYRERMSENIRVYVNHDNKDILLSLSIEMLGNCYGLKKNGELTFLKNYLQKARDIKEALRALEDANREGTLKGLIKNRASKR
ncbi:hypothetical protein AB751O23_DB_00010, partial [Chlamydiales bacterium SCGC AB-751-O23]